MKPLLLIGALVALLGVVTLAFPAFRTRDTKDVAKLGDVTIQSHENVLHVIPPTASIVAIVLGGGLMLAGVVLKGRD
jgi:hypothetical protein